MSGDRDLVHHFGAFAAMLRYEDVPPDAREAAKKSLLDTLGVSVAASGLEPATHAVLDIARESGGEPRCTVLALDRRAPPLLAALANGALAHGLDYDDQTPWGQHASSSIVPAVFAVAERRGGVSGKDMIAAVAAGQDVFARLRCNVRWKKDWNLSTVMGVFGGTVAAGRVMELDARRLTNALGIATMRSCGLMEMIAGRGGDLRGLYAGFSAEGAVLATLMAEKGVSGIDRAMEGRYGFLNTYFPEGHDRAAMLEGLGRDFLGGPTLYKRWPCVGTSHSHMKAAIDIVTAADLRPDDIAEVRLSVGDYHELMCRPLDERRAPATLADAKFSLPFLVAIAIVRRGMGVRDFSEAGLRDADVLAMARKIDITPDPALDWNLELPPGRVEIVALDGRRWSATGREVPGNADNPASFDDIAAKFRECVAAGPRPPSDAAVERAIDMAHRLEDLPDATALIRCLA